MDSDEAFDEFIELDEGESAESGSENESIEKVECNSEKENTFTKERKHIKHQQYVLMANFVKSDYRLSFLYKKHQIFLFIIN